MLTRCARVSAAIVWSVHISDKVKSGHFNWKMIYGKICAEIVVVFLLIFTHKIHTTRTTYSTKSSHMKRSTQM